MKTGLQSTLQFDFENEICNNDSSHQGLELYDIIDELTFFNRCDYKSVHIKYI